MKIIFFGSSDFAVPVLDALKDKEEVLLVVTQPDRKRGRSLKMASPPVKEAADRVGIRVFQTGDVNSKDSIDYLKRFDAGLFVVVSFGQILQRGLLEVPDICSVNVHASLLPKYRGAAPINWALANGDTETGITVIKMNERMDEGEIVLKEAVPVKIDEDAIRLSERLSNVGAGLLLNSIEMIKTGKVRFLKQDAAMATYAPKLKKEDGLIDWQWSAEKIYNRVRAFVPWPGCFTCCNKKILKIWRAEIIGTKDLSAACLKCAPGTVVEVNKEGILVSTGRGLLRIKELQIEGKRRMKVEEFIAGHKDIKTGTVLSCAKGVL